MRFPLRTLSQIILFFLFLLPFEKASAQLTVTPNQTAITLVNSLVGSGVTVSNAVYTGDIVANGKFTYSGVPGNFGMSKGIVLSSGKAIDAEGPNNVSNKSTALATPGDALLNTIISGTTKDAAILEFDFIPTTTTISFNYVFGSEEYNEYVNQSFNDVFAFFISGPGFTGSQNIALLPSTSTPVSINNVNNGYTSSGCALGPCTNCNFYVDNCGNTINVQYDGLTVLLRAQAVVVPNQTYHLKIVIADVDDENFDSGVFLQEGSFSSSIPYAGPDITTCSGDSGSIGSIPDPTNKYSWAPITGLSNPNSASTKVMWVNNSSLPQQHQYILTTTDGAGNLLNNDSVIVNVMPVPHAFAGKDTTVCFNTQVQLGLTPGSSMYNYVWTPPAGLNNSQIAQPIATVTASTTYIFTATDTSVAKCTAKDTVIINLLHPQAIGGPDLALCNGDTAQMGGSSQTGTFYKWSPSTGISNPNISNPKVFPSSNTTYILTASGINNSCSVNDTVIVKVGTIPTAKAGSDISLCRGSSTSLGNPPTPGVSYLWTPSTGLSNPNISNPTISPVSNNSYVLTAVEISSGCNAKDTVLITVHGPIVTIPKSAAICAGNSVKIGIPNNPSYTFKWDASPTISSTTISDPVVNPVVTTKYVLTTKDSFGCFTIDTVKVTVNPLPVIDAGSNKTVCTADTVTIGLTNNAGYTYKWSPGKTLNDSTLARPVAKPLSNGKYIVIAKDKVTGCVQKDSMQITALPLPTGTAGADQKICVGTGVSIGGSSTPGFTYAWSPTTGLAPSNTSNPFASPVITTSYVLTITNPAPGNGCTKKDTVNVTIYQLPAINAGPDKAVCTGSGIIIGTAANPQYTYVWSPGKKLALNDSTNATPTAKPSVTTTYVLTSAYTFLSTCKKSDTVVVNVKPIPNAIAGADVSICKGGSVTIGMGNDTSYSFLWNPSSTLNNGTISAPLATPLVTTTYILTVADKQAGCQKKDTVVISVSIPPVNAGPDTTFCFGSSFKLGTTGVAGYTYKWSPATALTNSSLARPVASPTATTTYRVSVSDAQNCMSVDSAKIIVNPLPLADAGPDHQSCAGAPVGIGVVPDVFLTYSWSPAATLAGANTSSPTASPKVTTNYILTVTDAKGCKKSDTMKVVTTALPPAVAGPNSQLCSGDSIKIGSVKIPGLIYAWTSDTTLRSYTISDPFAHPHVTRKYHLLVTDSLSGCVNKDSTIITVNPLPGSTLISNDNVCKGTLYPLNPGCVATNTYKWNADPDISNINICSPNLNVKANGTYTVTVTSSLGCSIKRSITIDALDVPVTNLSGPVAICKNSFTQLSTISNPNYKYTWTPASSLNFDNIYNPIATPVVNTRYRLTVTDATGKCSKKDSIDIVVNAPKMPTILIPTICRGTLNTPIASSAGLPAGLIFNWSPASTLNSSTIANPLASPTVTTTYRLRVTDPATGCTDTTSSTVTVNTVTGFAGPDTAICFGSSAHLGLDTNSVTNTYSWSGGVPSDKNPLVTPVSSTTYTVTITDGVNGCTKTDAISVRIKTSPAKPAPVPSYIFCNGDSKNIGISDISGYSYLWTPSTGLSDANISNPVATPLNNTIYQVKTILDSTQCADSATVDVSVAFSSVSLTPKMLCKFDSIYLNPSAITTESYTWSPATGLDVSTVVNPKAKPLTTTTYFVTVTSPAGCPPFNGSLVVNVSKDTVSLTVTDTTICSTSALNLSPVTTGGVTSYEWSYNGLFSPLISSMDVLKFPYLIQDTSIFVRVNNGYASGACTKSDTIRVKLDNVPISTHDIQMCDGQSLSIMATGDPNFNYSWSPKNNIIGPYNQQVVTVKPEKTTTYYVKATDKKGCESNKPLVVTVASLDAIATVDKEFIYAGESAQLHAEPQDTWYSYSWTPAVSLSNSLNPNPVANPVENTVYSLEVIDNNTGCVAKGEVLLRVRANGNCGEPDIFIPTAFTPDGDMHNDYLEVKGHYIKDLHMVIFNRWGQKVKEMFSQSDKWDGTYEGKFVEPGVFVYYVEITCIGGEKYSKKGNVTVIR